MKALVLAITLISATPVLAQNAIEIDTGISPMPEHVRARIEELRMHGDRFAPVIAAIEAEWTKPSWAECDGSDDVTPGFDVNS